MSYEPYEVESYLNTDNESKAWSGYVLMPTVITKFRKAGFTPSEVRSDGAHLYSNIPFECISIRRDSSKSKTKRVMTPEQKRSAGERLKNAREAKSTKL